MGPEPVERSRDGAIVTARTSARLNGSGDRPDTDFGAERVASNPGADESPKARPSSLPMAGWRPSRRARAILSRAGHGRRAARRGSRPTPSASCSASSALTSDWSLAGVVTAPKHSSLPRVLQAVGAGGSSRLRCADPCSTDHGDERGAVCLVELNISLVNAMAVMGGGWGG